MDIEIMLLRVDKTYRQHGINASMAMITNSLDISNITNDKGENYDEDMNLFEYDYEEESTEPPQVKIDKMAPSTEISERKNLQHLMRISTFNKAYMQNVGVMSELGSPARVSDSSPSSSRQKRRVSLLN